MYKVGHGVTQFLLYVMSSVVSLTQSLDQSYPPCIISINKCTERESRDISHHNRMMKGTDTFLKYLVRDQQMSDVALQGLEVGTHNRKASK
jgi:hypothetical protein